MADSVFGRLNPKNGDCDNLEVIDINNFKATRPTILCFSGNAATSIHEMIGFCEMIKDLIGLKESEKEDEIFEYADVLGVAYAHAELGDIGSILSHEIKAIVDNLFLPLCVKKGEGSIEETCKNLSRFSFFTFCHGSIEVMKICDMLNNKLLNDYGYSPEDTDAIFASMMHVSYSPNAVGSFTPMVYAVSGKDRMNGTEVWGFRFNNKNIATKLIEPNNETSTYFPKLAIYAQKLSSDRNNEHGVSIVRRDNNWKIECDGQGADVVSQMLGCALSFAVINGMKNFNSDNYIPHMNLFEMQQELNNLIENEKNMLD